MARSDITQRDDHSPSNDLEISVLIVCSFYLLANIILVFYLGLKFQASNDRDQLLMNRSNSILPSEEEDGHIERSFSMTNRERRQLFLALSRLESRKITMIPEERDDNDDHTFGFREADEEDSEDEDDLEERFVKQKAIEMYSKHVRRNRKTVSCDSVKVYDLTDDLVEVMYYESIGLSSALEEEEPPDIELPPEINYPSVKC